MIDIGPIAAAFHRVADMFRQDPARGLNSAVSHARIEEGLTCHVQEGDWSLVADLSKGAGGARQGPTPGVLGRAALGSCIAIGFVLEAARAGVPIDSVDVTVEADFDDGAFFGVSDAHPGYLDVRYRVTVCSDAPEEDLQGVARAADARSPYVDVFGRAQSVRGDLRVERPARS